MIVRHFLHWALTAPVHERAEATKALAHAYLNSEITPAERAAAEGVLISLLDDPSPIVRAALAQALAFSKLAPVTIIHVLAADQPEVASLVLEHSPLLSDADLVEAVAGGRSEAQLAVALRTKLSASVAAAIAEVGCAKACLALIENPGAAVAKCSIDCIVARHGHLGAIREALLNRSDLSISTHQAILAKLTEALTQFAATRAWVRPDQAMRLAREACEKATVVLVADSSRNEIETLVRHLRDSGQLTAGLILRALLSGNVGLLEQALAELSDMPIARVRSLVCDRRSPGFRALYNKAGLPASAFAAFREALEALQEAGFAGGVADPSRLDRRLVERVMMRCAAGPREEVAPLLALLRRFALEAAREEARLYRDTLVEDGTVTGHDMSERAAA